MQQELRTAPSDGELLRAYAETQSDAAFSEIVRRYQNMVYTAALRQVGNAATAEDLTQAVFIVLSRKASGLSRDTILSGWLFRAVRFAAMDIQKTGRRREERERSVVMDAGEETDARWEEIAPWLDDGLAELGERDRDAVLLRFFDQKPWSEVGAALRMNENSARVRVTRALDKLRFWFAKRGISVSVVALGGLLTANAVQAAPAIVIAGGAGSTVATSLAGAIARRWLLQKVMRAAMWGVIGLGLVGGGVWVETTVERVKEAAQRTAEERRAAQRAADLRAINEAIVAFDNLLYNNPAAFTGAMFLRPQHEPMRAVFLGYGQAFAVLRDELRARFADRQVRYGVYRLLLDELLRGQPTPARTYVDGDRGGSDRLRRCTVEFVRVNGAWQWDFFGALTPEAAAERIAVLRHKTEVMGQLTARLRAGELTDARQVLKDFDTL